MVKVCTVKAYIYMGLGALLGGGGACSKVLRSLGLALEKDHETQSFSLPFCLLQYKQFWFKICQHHVTNLSLTVISKTVSQN